MMPLSPKIIEDEYQRLGHTLGWRFLSCPEKNIDTAAIALVTTNPGGASFELPKWSVEEGSAYAVESWKECDPGQEKLQRQVIRMFEIMDVKPEEVISGYFVPFRSRGWKSLPKKSDSIQFGKGLWGAVFERVNLQTVLAFGKDIAPHMQELLKATLHAKRRADWGDMTIDVYRFGQNQNKRLVVLPHLSQFSLFNRPHSESECRFREAIAL